jgi:AcrR family transcriptional regulator
MRRSPATADKPEAILQAALELFVERGFHGTVVPAIAERAGVGAGTLYRYFDDKDAIVNALYLRWKTEVAAILREELASALPLRDRFDRFLGRMYDFGVEHPLAMRFLETHHHQDYLDARCLQVGVDMQAPILSFFVEAIAAGLLRDGPPALLASIVWGGLTGALRGVWSGAVEPSPEARDATITALWAAIARPA